MANMSLNKVPMNEQDPNVRNKNFFEVATGYNEEQAIEEAKRCLNCKHKPCVNGCPVSVRIPEFIQLCAQGEFLKAYKVIKSTNALPAVCGRVCPQENQCEKVCVRAIKGEPVGIGRLERFCADFVMKNNLMEKPQPIAQNGKKVAVVGGGPASLTVAGDLCDMGYHVTIFEAFHKAGGVLIYGIPEFRLPKDLVQKEIDMLSDKGVEIKTNMVIGRILTIDQLKDMGYDAIFIGTGAGSPKFMNIPGESLNTVFSASEFLTRVNLMKAYEFPTYDTPAYVGESCAIIGGGNVAMDAARTAKRLGAKNVYIIYRRGEDEMPARKEEIEHAKQEGIVFKMLIAPKEILGDDKGNVIGISCVEMELGALDHSNRRKPIEKPDTQFIIDVNSVIMAIGQSSNPIIKDTTTGLKTQKWGGIVIDEATGETSVKGVYAGGDAVSGAATVILAMGAGKISAYAIDQYLQNI